MVDSQSATSHSLPQTKRWLNFLGGIKKENKQENDNHMMTSTTSWKDPSTSKVAQGI